MNLSAINSLNADQQRQLSLAVAAIFGVLTLAYIVLEVYDSYSISQNPVSQPQQIATPSNTSQHSQNAHLLFGHNQQPTTNKPLPNTQLRLTLRGAFTASDPKKATAIIETTQHTRSYRVDSLITGNTKLHAVYADRVVLSNGGQLETLYFPVTNNPSALPANQAISNSQLQAATQKANALSEDERKAMIKRRLQELRAKVKAQGL